jgi:hypothetical protein
MVCLFLVLIFYHSAPEMYWPVGPALDVELYRGLFGIVRVAVAVVVFVFLVFNPLTTRLFLWNRYIAGIYEGTSVNIEKVPRKEPDTTLTNGWDWKDKEPIVDNQFNEYFTIRQSLFEAHITGRSLRSSGPGGALETIWTARLFRVEGLNFYFACELSTPLVEDGTMRLNIEGGEARGFYYSGEPGYPDSFRLYARRRSGLITRGLRFLKLY